MPSIWHCELPLWPARVQQLMAEPGSFTEALRARLGAIAVQPLQQHWQVVRGDEADALDLAASQPCFIREVLLKQQEQPVIFARTVIPARSLLGANRELTRLGGKALGALLFAGHGVRETLEFHSLDGRDVLSRRMLQLSVPWQRGLPARRSRFLLRGRPLLVQEVALPALSMRLSAADPG